MASYNSEVICLNLRPVGEADGVALLFTRERGQVRALCQGIRRMQSSLASAAQPGTYSLASLAEGARRDILTQAQVRDYFPEIRGELCRLSAALYLLDLLAVATIPGQREDDLFDAALAALGALKFDPRPLAVVSGFELQLLEIHGMPFALDHCALCGSEVSGEEWLVSVASGGRICPRCRSRATSVARLSAQAGECLLALQAGNISRARDTDTRATREIRGVLSRFVTYHLGQDFKSRQFMNSVLLS